MHRHLYIPFVIDSSRNRQNFHWSRLTLPCALPRLSSDAGCFRGVREWHNEYKICFLLAAPSAAEPRSKQRPAGPAASPASGAQAGPAQAAPDVLPGLAFAFPCRRAETAAGKHGPYPAEPFAASPAGGREPGERSGPSIPKGLLQAVRGFQPATQTTAKTGPASPEDG